MAHQAMVSKPQQLVRQMTEEIFHKHNLNNLSHYFSGDCNIYLHHNHVLGINAFRTKLEQYLEAFPDLNYSIDEMICEGNRAAIRWRAKGTLSNPLWGMEPTHKEVKWHGTTWVELSENHISKAWVVSTLAEEVAKQYWNK